MDSSFKKLISGTRPREVERAIEVLAAERPTRWRPVGDNENNLATINLGSDRAAGFVERITNAIDAVLEQE